MKKNVLVACIMMVANLSLFARPDETPSSQESSFGKLPSSVGDELDIPWKSSVTSADSEYFWIEELEYGLLPFGPGTLDMGGTDSPGRKMTSQQRVTLSRSFWMGEFEVTQGQYVEVMGENPSTFSVGEGVGWEERPVETVTWMEAVEFCRRLTLRFRNRLPVGYEFRLPTEAEWEFAARAYLEPDRCEGPLKGFVDQGLQSITTATRLTAQNHNGIHGMAGNVMEWCYDWYGKYADREVEDPVGATKGYCRVVRGGSWMHGEELARPTSRNYFYPDTRACFIGFRVVLGPSIHGVS